jgi:hypothetical protein
MAKEIEMQVFSVQHVLVEGSMRIVATVTVHPRVVRQWIKNVSNSLQKLEMKVICLDAKFTELATRKIQSAACRGSKPDSRVGGRYGEARS